MSLNHQIAQACRQHAGLGQDLVAMCVNDVLAQGAEPLFFLDYFSCGSLDVDVAASVVGGIAKACVAAGCALLGEKTRCSKNLSGMLMVLQIQMLHFYLEKLLIHSCKSPFICNNVQLGALL